MRQLADQSRVRDLMEALSRKARGRARIYFTGGATAVLLGWRTTTIDVDLRFLPERDDIFRALPALKESLRINIELAWPPDFIPEIPGWEERSIFIESLGDVSFYHYDLYSQALAKIERGHATDRLDVEEMIRQGLVEKARLRELFKRIQGKLYRYPAIDPASFRRAVAEWVGPFSD